METTTTEKATAPQTPEQDLAGSIGKNTLFGIIASLFQVGTRLVTIPIVINHLGLAGYGIWSIVVTAAAYMRFGSTGIKSAFQKYVAEATGSGDFENANKLLSTGTAAMMVISVVGLIPIGIYSGWLAQISGVPPEFLHDSKWAISLLALTMVFANGGAAYDSIVLGGHRIDLARKFNTVLCVAEAAATIALLHFGFGLVAMAAVMALSELTFLTCCYVASHRVVPQIRIRLKWVTKEVWRELLRFAGSYQLLNVLQVAYGAIVPIAILRSSGPYLSGVYAVANRLVSPIMMCLYAFLLSILSSGAMVYGTGAVETMRRLLSKSFKVTFALALAPLALISVFGPYLVEAWTGQTDPAFHRTIWLVSLATLFQSFSLLGLVFYRVTGRGLMDVIREALRIVLVLPVVLLAGRFNLFEALSWIAAAEFLGMLFMIAVIAQTFHAFDLRRISFDALRLAFATTGIVAAAAFAVLLVPSYMSNSRTLAAMRVGAVCLGTISSIIPALYLTGAISNAEMKSIFNILKRGGRTND